MIQQKKKQEIGFLQTLLHLVVVVFLVFCFFVVASAPSPANPYNSQDKVVVDVPKMIEIHTQNKKIEPKSYSKEELVCLSKNIFFEGRGTDTKEQIRIINVTTNRVKSAQFGGTYCDVVFDHAQFSWTLNLKKHNIARYVTEHKAWLNAQKMAKYELQFGYPDTTNGALYYHTPDVNPRWAHDGSNQEVLASNYHIYYKPN